MTDDPYVALAVLGVLFGGIVWELVWGLPGCVRDLIAPSEEVENVRTYRRRGR